MKSLLYRSRYSLISHIALWSSLAPMWQVHGCYTQALPLLASILPSTSEQEEPRFTVNFNNTSVIEVIRFVSKITGTNFVFSEEDLSFNVTIVSEEPISAKNITSALIQVLRVNGCKLLEQEGNFLITKAATAVNQIPTLILDDKSASLTAPLVTQIFTIKNTDVTALVNLIRPMTSQTSQLEVFAPTRQLLVTDISTNVEKISALIQALDILYPNLEIESYTSKNASLEVLFSLTKQVMEPFAGTTPFLLVPQEGTNTLFLVSTPTLLDKALSILEDLDATPQVAAPNKTQEHHLYKVLGESPETFLASLQTAAEQMGKAGSPALAQAVQDAKVIPKTRTILFTTDKDTWKQLQDMLSTLDAVDPSSMEKENLYLYKVKQGDEQKIQATLEQAAKNLKDPALQKTLEQAQWLSDTRSFLFSGSESSLRTLKELLPTLDTPSGEQSHLEIFTYQVQHATKEQMSSALHQVLTTTKDPDLTQALKNVQWVSGTNLLLFQGTQEAIIELKTLLPSLDVPSSSATKDQVFVYSPKNIQGTVLLQKVEELSDTLIRSDLQDADFLAALQSANWTSASQTLIFTGTKEALHKIEPLVHSLDVIPESAQEASLLYTYEVHHATKEQMSDALHLLLSTTQDASLISTIKSMQWVSGTNLLLFQGPASAVAKLKTLLPSLDVPPSATVKDQTLVYAPKHLQGDILLQKLQELTSNFSSSGLQDVGLLAALHSAKWMSSSQTLAFTGSQASLARVRSLLETLDVDPSSSPIGGKKSSHELLTYRVEHATKEQMSRALDQLLSSTDNDDLAAAIKSMQWVAGTHLLLFHGTSSAIHELKTLLPSLDTPSIEAAKNQVLIYTPKFLSGDVLVQKLQEITENFQSSGLQDQELLATLNSARWAAGSHTITFTGNQTSLSRVETLLGTLDVATAVKQQSFLYKPSSTTESQLQAALASYAKNLDPADPSDQALLEAINRASWVAASQAFLFQSDPATLTRLKSLLLSLDNPSGHFYLYKLQQAQGDTVVEQLQTLAAHLPSSDSKTAELVQAIQNLKWIQDNNTLLLVGTPAVIDQLKSLVAEYDHAGERSSKALQSEFFLYKPLYQDPNQLLSSLQSLTKDLSDSGLADQTLLQALNTARFVSSSNSLLFTGTTGALAKVRQLLPTVDKPSSQDAAIENVGNVTFLMYKVKQASAESLVSALHSFANTLQQSDLSDQELANSLNTVKWIQETNSLFFTGSEATLKKVAALAEKFDLGSAPTPTPEASTAPRTTAPSFVVYTPKAQTGSELISILYDFMQNLIHSGVSDPGLFDAINHLRYVAKTNSLIISGDTAAIQQIQELLTKFDVPGAEEPGSLAALNEANFLIYKLQYQPGLEIQSALKKVATSLGNTSPDANKALVDAISSLQWIEVTNSLIGTGDPGVLARVRELILNLDVPLRQVFIEVLVVETSLFNSQNFGLQWGTQFQYLNKTIGAMGNFPSVINKIANNNNLPTGSVDLSNPIANTTNLSTPVQGNSLTTPTAVPFSSGFDLGVIGDIIFHKGQSFISLGSLVNALQMDNDTTVVMNPKIITQDGHTSNIFVGQNIPFVGSFVSNTASNTVQSSNIEYRDVGVNLTITPSLGTNNIITLDIQQDISQQTNNTTQIQGSQVTGIQTSLTTMSTRVHVPDRHFLVLSGMIQDTKTHFRTSIPCLGGLPVIGALFSENDRYDTKNNIIIFLRPFIIDSFEDYDRLTAAEEGLYKEQAALQDLKEEFDAGTEMIKDLDNE